MGTAGAPKNLRTGPHTKDQTLQGNEGRYDVKKEKREKSIRFTLYVRCVLCGVVYSSSIGVSVCSRGGTRQAVVQRCIELTSVLILPLLLPQVQRITGQVARHKAPRASDARLQARVGVGAARGT